MHPRPAQERQRRAQAMPARYGAELVETDPTRGTDGAQRYVKSRVEADPGCYFYPDQYNNDANWKAHYETTAMEIWQQTEGRITHFVTGLGTSGHSWALPGGSRNSTPPSNASPCNPTARCTGLRASSIWRQPWCRESTTLTLPTGTSSPTPKRAPNGAAIGPSGRVSGRRFIRGQLFGRDQRGGGIEGRRRRNYFLRFSGEIFVGEFLDGQLLRSGELALMVGYRLGG